MSEKEFIDYKRIINGIIIAVVATLILSGFTLIRYGVVDHVKVAELVDESKTHVDQDVIFEFLDAVERRNDALEELVKEYKADNMARVEHLEGEIEELRRNIMQIISENKLQFRNGNN